MLHAFGLQLQRGYELQLLGDLTLIRLQRIVHQRARFLGHRFLGLEVTHFIRGQLRNPLIRGWTFGPCHHRGYGTLLGLLHERIVDAWISSDLPDLPDSPRYTVIPLWDWPGELLVNPCHPLVGERWLTRSDLSRFPLLILSEDLYPGLARLVHVKVFWPREPAQADMTWVPGMGSRRMPPPSVTAAASASLRIPISNRSTGSWASRVAKP